MIGILPTQLIILDKEMSKKNIFHTNFEKEAAHVQTPVKKNHQRVYFVPMTLGASILLFVFSFWLMLSTMPQLESIFGMPNPLSKTALISSINNETVVLRNTEHQLLQETREQAGEYTKLVTFNYTSSTPEVAVLADLQQNKKNWHRALTGIDAVIKKVVSANDIVQQITYSSLLLDAEGNRIILDGLRAYGEYNPESTENSEGSSISLATAIVDAFEASPYFKNLTVSEYSKKIEVSKDGYSEFFTPLTLQLELQSEDEVHTKDAQVTISDELENISNNNE